MIIDTDYYNLVRAGQSKVFLAPAVIPKDTEVLRRGPACYRDWRINW
jgi:hypothetical protein